MKRPPTLSVTEFTQLIEAMCKAASTEAASTIERMEMLRSATKPPG